FLPDQGDHLVWITSQLREGAAHHFNDSRYKLAKKGLGRAEVLPAIALRAAQNPPQHVAAALVARLGAVRQGDGERPDMVRDDAVGGVLEIVELARVFRRAGDLVDGCENRRENIRVIVTRLVL